MSNYIQINNYNNSLDCPICMEPLFLKNATVVAHEGEDGHKHPYHKHCISEWFRNPLNKPKCPTCRAEINTHSILSFKDRCIVQLTIAGNNLLIGSILGSMATATTLMWYDTPLAKGLKVAATVTAMGLSVITPYALEIDTGNNYSATAHLCRNIGHFIGATGALLAYGTYMVFLSNDPRFRA